MASDFDEYGPDKRHSSLAYRAIVAVAVLIVAALAMVSLYQIAVRTTTGMTAVAPVADGIPSTQPGEAASEALIVLDGAAQLLREPGAYGSHHVAYAFTEKYPASNAIQQISSRLQALGWTPLQEDWLNPGLPSSHISGWTGFLDGATTPMHHVRQWSAQWQDASGNIVDYTLSYSYPESGAPDLQTLWINGSWYPESGVKSMQQTTQRPDAEHQKIVR
jgi:hypothetical protein